MLVRKTLMLEECRLKMEGDTGVFEGYASRFGGVDTYGDTILAGAFASTLKNNGKPMMFFNHAWDMPIGVYTQAKEDDAGLYVKGEFTSGHSLAADVRASMKHGSITGLSIGGFVKKGDAEDRADGGQIITRFTRLIEVSPVVFPADAGARVDAATVRGEDIAEIIGECETIRQFERLLRDAGGFSKGTAAAMVVRAKAIFGGSGEPNTKQSDASAEDLIARLEAIAKRFG